MRYILQNLRDVLGKIRGYTGQKLWDILWDIFVKAMAYICKTMGYIQQDYGYIGEKLWDILG